MRRSRRARSRCRPPSRRRLHPSSDEAPGHPTDPRTRTGGVQFSMIFEAQMAEPSPAHEHQVIRDCVEQAVLAEQVGFDRVWAVEHHALKWYAHMSAPEVFLTWVAAKTSRIRLGHGVVCM